MKFVFIAEQEVVFSVSAMCQALVVTRSRSYAWKRRPPSASSKANAQLAAKVTAAHRRNRGFYGSPRIDRELRAQGVRVSKNRVERLMRENGPKERQQKKQFAAPRTGDTHCPSPERARP